MIPAIILSANHGHCTNLDSKSVFNFSDLSDNGIHSTCTTLGEVPGCGQPPATAEQVVSCFLLFFLKLLHRVSLLCHGRRILSLEMGLTSCSTFFHTPLFQCQFNNAVIYGT